MCASLLSPVSALADSCPAIIQGSDLAGVFCDFDSGSGVVVQNGGSVGGINQIAYDGLNITNNGIISNNSTTGITITDNSILHNGILNNGTISTIDYSIVVLNNSRIDNGIINTGSITSDSASGIAMFDSLLNGGINNSGSITTNNIDAAMFIGSSTFNGNLNNSGSIRTFANSNGIHIDSTTMDGNINNDGLIRGGNSGLVINILNSINGDITNNGAIYGDTSEGIGITNISAVSGDIINNGTIFGGTDGIFMDVASTVNGSIINQSGAIIRGNGQGIYINDSSVVAGGIQNYGTIQGNSFGIYISSDSTVNNIDLFEGSRVIGAIDAVSSNVNILGDFETEGTILANNVNISSGAMFTMANNITVQNTVANSGTLAIGTASRTISTGDYVQSSGGMFQVGLQNTSTYGQLAVSNLVDFSSSGAIDVDVVSGSDIRAGDVFGNIISGLSLLAPGGGFSVTDNSRLLNFTASADSTSVDLTAVDDGSTSVFQSNVATGNRGGLGAAQVLDNIIALNPAGDWQNVINALNSLSTDQEIANATNQTAPILTSVTNNAVMGTMGTISRVIQARQESNSGLSSGEDFLSNRNFWLKPFGSWGNLEKQNGVVGYDSRTYGIIGGADKVINDKTDLGIGVSYFNSDLNGTSDEVNVDSYLAMLYGSYSLNERTDINAQIDVGYNNSDSKRNINFGGLNRIAEGDYNGWDFHAGTGVGRLLKHNNTIIVPQLRLDYFVVSNQSYNESGAGVLNLNVDSQSQDQLIPALEVKANRKLNPKLSLSANAGLGYDLLNDNNSVSASFAGGGGTFITRGLEPSPWVARSGAGITWKQSDKIDLTMRYDREDRGSEYDNQTVSLKLSMPF